MWAIKYLLIAIISFLNTNIIFSIHNPMSRIQCHLGEELSCKNFFLICWRYQCRCMKNHILLVQGLGCLYAKFY